MLDDTNKYISLRLCRGLREAEARAEKLRDPSEMFDSLYMIEVAAVHFFRRAELGRHIKGKKAAQVDADYERAAYLAALAVPFRHARLSATKILGDPNSLLRIRDDASADEIRAEIMKRLEILTSAGLVDLQALPAPNGETVRQVRRGERSRTSAGTFWHRDEQRVALIAPVPTPPWHRLALVKRQTPQ